MTTTMMTKADFLATKPAWAKAALVAEYEVDKSDSMTDYFATSTERVVFLGWSAHTRDLFSEMRKAAATFPETAHLGPGKDLYTVSVVTAEDIVTNGSAYWKGSNSPWHRELYSDDGAGFLRGKTFTTRADADAFIEKAGKPHDIGFGDKVGTFEWKVTKESIEHREKYSMGAGYYLKGSGRYSSGWTVSKASVNSFRFRSDMIEVAVKPVATTSVVNSEPVAAVDGITVSLNAAKNGVEIKFPSKPSADVRNVLKANGWRWSRFNEVWYHRDTPTNREFANRLAKNPVSTAVNHVAALRGRAS